MQRGVFLFSILLVLAPMPANAHWCDCLWQSRYNVVVRPVVDSIDVPSTGSATLDIWVQNNMGYPLSNYGLTAQASNFDIAINIDESTRTRESSDFLMPGERLRHRLTITRGGSTSVLNIEDVAFFVRFGGGGQSGGYGSNSPPSSDVMIKRLDEALFPTAPGLQSDGNTGQARHLRSSFRADFAQDNSDRDIAIESLLNEYCAGRSSWDSSNGAPVAASCPSPDGPPDTTCGALSRGTNNNKYDWQHLWAAGELGYRKDVLTPTQLTAFRDRLYCGQDDQVFAFKAFALMVMGYLGDGAFSLDVSGSAGANASDFLTSIAGSSPSTPEHYVARAALHLMGQNYSTDMQSCLSNAGDPYAEMVCAAALGIVDGDDAAVEAEILPRVEWECPGDCDNGDVPEPLAFTAAHILNLVAWDRRGWTTDGDDVGVVSFYKEEAAAPRTPTGFACGLDASATPPALELSWAGVTQDVNSQDETYGVGYRVYWGTTAGNPVHTGYTTATSFQPPDLIPETTYYFYLIAVDDSMNESAPTAEIPCDAPIEANAPVAVISCNPTSGNFTLPVHCDCDDSTDTDGDIDHCYFHVVNEGTEQDGLAGGVDYSFDTPGTRTVVLRVTDVTGLEDTDQVQIAVNDPNNEAPSAVAAANLVDVTTGQVVTFDGSGSNDPDGAIAAYAWDFDDGNTSTEMSPTHTYTTAADYDVTLTVTDNGTPALTGIDVVRITVGNVFNSAPTIDSADVSPQEGPVGLTSTFTAVASDPDGDDVVINWVVASDQTEDVALTGATVQHTFTDEAIYSVTLAVRDVGPDDWTTTREVFTVTVGDSALSPENDAPTEIVGSCACTGAAGAVGWVVLLAALALRQRRR